MRGEEKLRREGGRVIEGEKRETEGGLKSDI